MATFSKEFLSASTNGLGIIVTSVSGGTSGTAGTIHAAPAGTTSKDEVWLWAFNGHTADTTLTLEWGTSASPRVVTVPYRAGLVPIVPGLPLNNGYKIQAYAGTSGTVVIDGFVNRITD